MDNSETYIKMRRQAIPDLGMGTPPVFSAGAEVQWLTTFVCTDIAGNFYYFSEDEQFQLERQYQLQEMVEEVIDKTHFVFRFNEFVESSYLPITHQLAYTYFANLDDEQREAVISMEQLWLAFVMKERYSKIWNGEEWIKS